MIKILSLALLLTSCTAFSQNDLKFIDLTEYRQAMPEFRLVDEKTGEFYSSVAHPGAVFVLEMYFNGCHYCNENAPNVARLVEEFKDNPKVQILDVSVDCSEGDYDSWISKHDPAEPVLNDCAGSVNDALGVSSYPTTIVFAPNGQQAMRGSGVWSDSTYDRIKAYLSQAK